MGLGPRNPSNAPCMSTLPLQAYSLGLDLHLWAVIPKIGNNSLWTSKAMAVRSIVGFHWLVLKYAHEMSHHFVIG